MLQGHLGSHTVSSLLLAGAPPSGAAFPRSGAQSNRLAEPICAVQQGQICRESTPVPASVRPPGPAQGDVAVRLRANLRNIALLTYASKLYEAPKASVLYPS